jgi:hypothetical protein
MVKVTFTFDEETVLRLRRTAARLTRPQSVVVREAIRDYSDRVGRLSEEERTRLLQTFDRLMKGIPLRPVADVHSEIRAIRRARRQGGRGHSAGRRRR